jgi:hypothetical protein
VPKLRSIVAADCSVLQKRSNLTDCSRAISGYQRLNSKLVSQPACLLTSFFVSNHVVCKLFSLRQPLASCLLEGSQQPIVLLLRLIYFAPARRPDFIRPPRLSGSMPSYCPTEPSIFFCSPTRRSIKYHSLEFTAVTRNKQQIDLHQTRGVYHLRQEIKAKQIHTVLVYGYCTIENINQDTIRASPSNRTRNRPTQLEINKI